WIGVRLVVQELHAAIELPCVGDELAAQAPADEFQELVRLDRRRGQVRPRRSWTSGPRTASGAGTGRTAARSGAPARIRGATADASAGPWAWRPRPTGIRASRPP